MNLIDKVWVTKLKFNMGLLPRNDYIDLLNLYYAKAVQREGK